MSVYTKQLLFAVVGLIILGVIGFWAPDVQRLLGMFAIGWMMMDIARDVFPEEK
jgi:Na+-transporting methylmalonyl-CoA/oxaloacetate decarboxylase beta subunit